MVQKGDCAAKSPRWNQHGTAQSFESFVSSAFTKNRSFADATNILWHQV
jgi:hypothetical protein